MCLIVGLLMFLKHFFFLNFFLLVFPDLLLLTSNGCTQQDQSCNQQIFVNKTLVSQRPKQMMFLDAPYQLLYNMLNLNPNQVGKTREHFSATFGFEIVSSGQVSSACYNGIEMCDTKEEPLSWDTGSVWWPHTSDHWTLPLCLCTFLSLSVYICSFHTCPFEYIVLYPKLIHFLGFFFIIILKVYANSDLKMNTIAFESLFIPFSSSRRCFHFTNYRKRRDKN